MAADEIHREMSHIHEIRELGAIGIGFIAADGFERKEPGYLYCTAEDLYA